MAQETVSEDSREQSKNTQQSAASVKFQVAVMLSYFGLTIACNMLGRYNRAGDDTYCASSLVVLTEVLKLSVCIIASLMEVGLANLSNAICSRQTIWFALPSLAYTLNKNLDLASMKRLELPIYMLVIEAKSVLTALWSCLLLGRRFSSWQMLALFLLAFGDSLAIGAMDSFVVPHEGSHGKKRSSHLSHTGFDNHEYVIGVLCGLVGITMASVASVFMEGLLKKPGSLFVRNVQIGCSALPISIIVLVCGGDLPRVQKYGFFQGMTPAVWLLSCMVVTLGVLMAAILRHVSAVAIGFVRACALTVITFISIPLFAFKPAITFFVGGPIVVGSLVLYAWASNTKGKASITSPPEEEPTEAASLLQSLEARSKVAAEPVPQSQHIGGNAGGAVKTAV